APHVQSTFDPGGRYTRPGAVGQGWQAEPSLVDRVVGDQTIGHDEVPGTPNQHAAHGRGRRWLWESPPTGLSGCGRGESDDPTLGLAQPRHGRTVYDGAACGRREAYQDWIAPFTEP